ncbi:alkyl hydroperoxide reductase [filamentous cyanobacterium CCP5]|nr:alkyl hydroperoxide reductase [filamentous cyanobacterium CCP5]
MLTSTDFSGLINPRFFRNFLPVPPWGGLAFGDRTPDFALRDVTHQRTVRLSNYWGQRPVIVAFARIFTDKQYCPFCFPGLMALNEAYEQFKDQGAELLMVTSTDHDQSQIVVRDLNLKLPLLSDPSCESFRRYYTGQALGAPLPGEFVLDAQGRLRYRHLFSFLEHNASPDTLLEVLSRL